ISRLRKYLGVTKLIVQYITFSSAFLKDRTEQCIFILLVQLFKISIRTVKSNLNFNIVANSKRNLSKLIVSFFDVPSPAKAEENKEKLQSDCSVQEHLETQSVEKYKNIYDTEISDP
ncbi:hypothetical protein L9F63_016006, partial [Diploptera punctata]